MTLMQNKFISSKRSLIAVAGFVLSVSGCESDSQTDSGESFSCPTGAKCDDPTENFELANYYGPLTMKNLVSFTKSDDSISGTIAGISENQFVKLSGNAYVDYRLKDANVNQLVDIPEMSVDPLAESIEFTQSLKRALEDDEIRFAIQMEFPQMGQFGNTSYFNKTVKLDGTGDYSISNDIEFWRVTLPELDRERVNLITIRTDLSGADSDGGAVLVRNILVDATAPMDFWIPVRADGDSKFVEVEFGTFTETNRRGIESITLTAPGAYRTKGESYFDGLFEAWQETKPELVAEYEDDPYELYPIFVEEYVLENEAIEDIYDVEPFEAINSAHTQQPPMELSEWVTWSAGDATPE